MNMVSTKFDQIVILDTHDLVTGFNKTLTNFKIGDADRNELLWQIITCFEDHRDTPLWTRLTKLPNYDTLRCKFILDDSCKESYLKNLVVEFGMALHQQIKLVGLYDTGGFPPKDVDQFPFMFGDLIRNDVILKRIKSDITEDSTK